MLRSAYKNSQSDEEGSKQGDEPEVEPEVVQENVEDMVDSDQEDGDRESFLYLKCTDIDITSLSAYRVTEQVCNVLYSVTKLVQVNRCLRVTCISREEQNRLKQLKFIVGHPVKITEPFTRVKTEQVYQIGGSSSGWTMTSLTMNFGVKAEKSIKRRGGAMIRTAQVILHFEGSMQEYARLGWKRHRVSPYIPEPIKCQRFGHIEANCSARKPRCPICAGQHPYEECELKDHRTERKAVCPNCRGPHPAFYQGCPAFKQAKW